MEEVVGVGRVGEVVSVEWVEVELGLRRVVGSGSVRRRGLFGSRFGHKVRVSGRGG